MPQKPRYMLVDGNALIHRGFHALPNLATKSGEPTGAVYGFLMILLKAMQELKPTHVICTFDLAGPTFRHERYAEYKAHRVKAAQELYDQIPRVKEAVRALGIPIFEKEGFEADDVIGTLARRLYEQRGGACEIIIVTGDLDTLQLVNGSVKVFTMRKGLSDTVLYDGKSVRERYGLQPSQMVDYKALRGDPSDNIKGVKGIGEKTAQDLIQQFGSIDELYSAIASGSKKLEKIRPKVLELLRAGEREARESFMLSTIVTDVPLDVDVPPYELDQEHLRQTLKIFQDLEFKSLLAKLPKPGKGSAPLSDDGAPETAIREANSAKKFKQDYRLIASAAELERVVKALGAASELCVDTETTGLRVQDSRLVGVGVCAEEGVAYYVPAELAHKSGSFKQLLARTDLPKVGHNLKFDFAVLAQAGLPLGGLSFDTMLASYLLNAGSRQYSLDSLAFTELGYQMQPIAELIGEGKDEITMDQVPPEKVAWYCGEDVDITLRLKHLLEPRLKGEKLDQLLRDIDLPIVPALADMEAAGIALDVRLMARLSAEAEVDIKQLERDIYKLTGTEFNLNSPKQMKDVLFENMKLVPVENRRTKSGLSTAADELEKMRDQHPVIGKILEYRELSKLQSTYLLALPQMVSKETGRIHTNFNQTIAATGRLSSTDPNLQNIPVRGEGLGSKVRTAFVAAPGFELLSLDYSQIELRVAAHLSLDPKMVEVFKTGQDIHARTAAEIYGVPQDKVTKDMRRDAKTINFGILYGVSSFGLSSRVQEMSRQDAKEFIDRYFQAYPKLAECLEQIKLQVREEGFVRSETGRIRRFPEIHSSQFAVRQSAERAAVNFPFQSLAADVIKLAMIKVFAEIEHDADVRMLLQVHDELLFEVRAGTAARYAALIRPLMENALPLKVPVVVEAKSGPNWGDMVPLTT